MSFPVTNSHNACSMRGFGMKAKPQWKSRRRACIGYAVDNLSLALCPTPYQFE